ncbi:MAG: sufI [Paucimonas sp.]|nr:sufI [Paucimonas sp.]
MKPRHHINLACGTLLLCGAVQAAPLDVCPRYPAGSIVTSPPDASQGADGAFHLFAHNAGSGPEDPANPNFDYRFCLLDNDDPAREQPVLRLNAGQRVNLVLSNRMESVPGFPAPHVMAAPGTKLCVPLPETLKGDISLTNLHYHGMNVSPMCAGDETINTIVAAQGSGGTADFRYSFAIPSNEPPGLYWYHPHVHGIAQQQMLGGMTGVITVAGMEKFYPAVAGLTEKILVLRDSDKPNPADNPNASEDEPWKNVSVNFVPVNWDATPGTPLPRIQAGAGERQFWRVANAAADTAFVLKLQFRNAGQDWQDQPLELVARDAVPVTDDNGIPQGRQLLQNRIVLPPAARAEFIITGPPAGTEARLYSDDYNDYLLSTNPNPNAFDATDRQPARVLAQIETTAARPQAASMASSPSAHTERLDRFAGLMVLSSVRARSFFFTKDPAEDGNFFITQEGNKPHAFAMESPPEVVVNMPAVEEWTVQNRDNESHVFHIHQVHFRVLEVNGAPVDPSKDATLLDTIVLPPCRDWGNADPEDPYANDPDLTGTNCKQPASVKLRMDFRSPDVAGTFVYHCHILEHEDKGMMAKIALVWNPQQAAREARVLKNQGEAGPIRLVRESEARDRAAHRPALLEVGNALGNSLLAALKGEREEVQRPEICSASRGEIKAPRGDSASTRPGASMPGRLEAMVMRWAAF